MRQYVYLTWYDSICQNEGRDFDSTADFFMEDFDEGLEMESLSSYARRLGV